MKLLKFIPVLALALVAVACAPSIPQKDVDAAAAAVADAKTAQADVFAPDAFKALTDADTALQANLAAKASADAAQANDFQAPATHSNPMLEEWWYLDAMTNFSGAGYYGHGHFRHNQRANVTFADGHVGSEKMVDGSLDRRLPSQHLGQLRPEILTVP